MALLSLLLLKKQRRPLAEMNGKYLRGKKILLVPKKAPAPPPQYCIDHKVCYKDYFQRGSLLMEEDEGVLFVANLSPQTKILHIKEFFDSVGEVVSVRLIVNHEGKHVGYGFVEFASTDEAKKALENKNGEYLHDHKIFLDVAKKALYPPQPKYNLAEKLCYEDYIRCLNPLIEEDESDVVDLKGVLSRLKVDAMKIELVFIPSPGIGHMRSTTEIAKLLIDGDDRVSVTLIVIPPKISGEVSSSVYTESKGRLRYCLLPTRDQPTEQTFISYIDSHKPLVRAIVSELTRDVSSRSDSAPRLAGIFVDMFCTSMIDIADEFCLPAYTFYTSNASFLGLQFQVQSLYDEKKLDVSDLKDSDKVFDVPTLTRPFPAKCLPSVMLSKEWFPYVLNRARSLRDTKGILVNSVAEMEPQALKFFSDGSMKTPPVYAVGPVLDFKTDDKDSGDEKRSEILHWLDKQPSSSVVFLCFGSMGSFSEEQAREIAVALERSGHRFLWSLRRASPVEHITGSPPGEFENLEEILPEGFLDRTVEIGKIISWAPQVAILKNPAIGAFVTHCGWNSILESLWFGVPMAAWPIYAEQQFNAFHMVEELGLAAEIREDYRRDSLFGEPKMVTAEEIERGIKCAMEQDSKMRKRVKEVRDKLHVALMDGGSSNAALRKFVQDVVENIP